MIYFKCSDDNKVAACSSVGFRVNSYVNRKSTCFSNAKLHKIIANMIDGGIICKFNIKTAARATITRKQNININYPVSLRIFTLFTSSERYANQDQAQ